MESHIIHTPSTDNTTQSSPDFVWQWAETLTKNDEFPAVSVDQGFQWVHGHRADQQTKKWIESLPMLSTPIKAALLAEDTRPRVEVCNEGILIIIRAVELVANMPEEMPSLRLWIDEKRLISLRNSVIMGPKQ